MRVTRSATVLLLVLAAAASGTARLHAANVRHLTLPELVARADRIVRGTVVGRVETSVPVGGGALPVTLYRIRVAETLKGAAASGELLEVRLLAAPKAARTGSMVRGAILRDLPEFNLGQEYLFLLTRPSAVGLSTTVGWQQGLFELRGRGAGEVAINGANNLGLLDPPASAAAARTGGARPARPPNAGPIPYATIAGEIRALIAR